MQLNVHLGDRMGLSPKWSVKKRNSLPSLKLYWSNDSYYSGLSDKIRPIPLPFVRMNALFERVFTSLL